MPRLRNERLAFVLAILWSRGRFNGRRDVCTQRWVIGTRVPRCHGSVLSHEANCVLPGEKQMNRDFEGSVSPLHEGREFTSVFAISKASVLAGVWIEIDNS
jgi:hypothetical protein